MVFYMMQYVYDMYISLLYTNHVVECQLYTWLCHCVFVYAHDCILATYLRDVHLFIHASGTTRSTRDFNYFRHHRGWNSLGKWELRKPIKLHLKGSHWKSVAVIVVRETIILGAALLVCFEELFFASFQWIG